MAYEMIFKVLCNKMHIHKYIYIKIGQKTHCKSNKKSKYVETQRERENPIIPYEACQYLQSYPSSKKVKR